MSGKPRSYGEYSRFAIEPSYTRDGDVVFMVRDATWITDHEIFVERRRSPTVAQFETRNEAEKWCDFVEEGKVTSVPHEANFEGWPALKARVQASGK